MSQFSRASGSAGGKRGSSSGGLIPVWFFVLIFLSGLGLIIITSEYDTRVLIQQQQLNPDQIIHTHGVIELLSKPFSLPADEPLLIELSFPDELLPAFLNIYLVRSDLDLDLLRHSPDKGSSSDQPTRALSLGAGPHHGEGFVELANQKQLPEVLTAELARSYHETYEFLAYSPKVALSSQLAVPVGGQYRIYYRGISEPYAGILPKQPETTSGVAGRRVDSAVSRQESGASLPPPAPYSTFDFFIFTGYVDQQYKLLLGMGLLGLLMILSVTKDWLNKIADFWVARRLSRGTDPDRRPS